MTEKLVTVAEYSFLPEAQTYQLHLESAGIPSFLADAETVAMDWALGAALGYIKLQVPQSQAEAALKILDESCQKRKEELESKSTENEGMKCLSCGAKMTADQLACAECGWSYAESDEQPTNTDEGETISPATAEAEPVETTEGWTEGMRAIKGPMLMLILGPLIAVSALIVFTLCRNVLSHLLSFDNRGQGFFG